MTLETTLAILQQSEYHWQYFLDWYNAHRTEKIMVQPKQWTGKLRLLKKICSTLFFLPLLTRLRVALQLIQVIEAPIKWSVEFRAKRKLQALKKNGLIIVGIAGSYAKTSTKHILSHALSENQTILMTPASVNTPLGISYVILNQLTKKHTLFIAELGEYYQNDIMKLAQFVEPDYGIVTPIGHQHIERMGSLANVARTIGELIEYFKADQTKVLVADANKQFFRENLAYYGENTTSEYHIEHAEVSTRGTEFNIVINNSNQHWHAFMPLFGKHQAVNTLPSIWLAEKLGIEPASVIKKLSTTPYISRRHEPHFNQHNVLILDNSYNTNPEAMQSSLDLLAELPAEQKVIITMGYVELGKESDQLHYELGKKLASAVDAVGLITSRDNGAVKKGYLENGGSTSNFFEADTPEHAFALLSDTIKPSSIVLFEGGYQELFS